MRYSIKKGSVSGHCCFEYTVIDSIGLDGKELTICETFDKQCAELIVDALKVFSYPTFSLYVDAMGYQFHIDSDGNLLRSMDGIHWITHKLPSSERVMAFYWDPVHEILVAILSETRALTSVDGIIWVIRPNLREYLDACGGFQ